MNEDDINKLNTKVRPNNHPDLMDVNLYIVPTRNACTRYNMEYLNS